MPSTTASVGVLLQPSAMRALEPWTINTNCKLQTVGECQQHWLAVQCASKRANNRPDIFTPDETPVLTAIPKQRAEATIVWINCVAEDAIKMPFCPSTWVNLCCEEEIDNHTLILTSSQGGQVSRNYPSQEMSLFTFFFLYSIHNWQEADRDGDGALSFKEILGFINDEKHMSFYSDQLYPHLENLFTSKSPSSVWTKAEDYFKKHLN